MAMTMAVFTGQIALVVTESLNMDFRGLFLLTKVPFRKANPRLAEMELVGRLNNPIS